MEKNQYQLEGSSAWLARVQEKTARDESVPSVKEKEASQTKLVDPVEKHRRNLLQLPDADAGQLMTKSRFPYRKRRSLREALDLALEAEGNRTPTMTGVETGDDVPAMPELFDARLKNRIRAGDLGVALDIYDVYRSRFGRDLTDTELQTLAKMELNKERKQKGG